MPVNHRRRKRVGRLSDTISHQRPFRCKTFPHPDSLETSFVNFTATLPFTLAALLSTAPALASEELAKQKACLTCHAMQTKVIGPSFADIAAKYKSDKDADTKLAVKIRAGGSGVWGQIPMPPNAAVSEAEAKTLAKWLMTVAAAAPAKK